MKNTIIKVSHDQYTERIILNASNRIEVTNYLHDKIWQVETEGDFIIDEMEHKGQYEMIVCTKVGEKVLPFYECCERPQKVKTSSKGQYIHIYGQRFYFNRYQA